MLLPGGKWEKTECPSLCSERSRSRGLMVSGGIYWKTGKLQAGCADPGEEQRASPRPCPGTGHRVQGTGHGARGTGHKHRATKALARPARKPARSGMCRTRVSRQLCKVSRVSFKNWMWCDCKPKVLPLLGWPWDHAREKGFRWGFLKANYLKTKFGASLCIYGLNKDTK